MDSLYHINDVLTDLINEHGADVDDDTLNELTHHVANVLGFATDPVVETLHNFYGDPDGYTNDEVMERAATILAPIYDANTWTWTKTGVPTFRDILIEIQRLYDCVGGDEPDSDWIECGRLVVCKDPYNDETDDEDLIRLFLDLGTLHNGR